MNPPNEQSSREQEREQFEVDAYTYDFDLERFQCAAPEPWSEYKAQDTGHRWAGWLARAERESAQPGYMQAIELAELFHQTYEELAPSFGYETRPETREFKHDSPNGALMVEVMRRLRSALSGSAESGEAVEKVVIHEDRMAAFRNKHGVPQHHGECFGVTVKKREGASDLFELFVEDDELWHFVTAFDVHWLPELLRVLQAAAPPTPSALPAQAVGEKDPNLQQAEHGELDPRTALDHASKMRQYVFAFNGEKWDATFDPVDRRNLATALDNLEETTAMLMNMAGRVHPTPQALSDEGKDAARYRWLREVWPMTLLEDLLHRSVGRHPSAELDEAIDAAMKGGA